MPEHMKVRRVGLFDKRRKQLDKQIEEKMNGEKKPVKVEEKPKVKKT